MNIACTVKSHNTESKCFSKTNCLISIFALLLMLVKIDHWFHRYLSVMNDSPK